MDIGDKNLEIFKKAPVLLRALPYWHDFGDVILEVKNDDTIYKFRVHRHILSWHSLVWKDMFESGKDLAGNLILDGDDGLPVVPLTDPVKDICALIWAFYNGVYEFYGNAQLDGALGLSLILLPGDNSTHFSDLEITLGLLTSSDKYQADKIHRMVIELLLEHWPLEYATYFAIESRYRSRLAGSIDLIRAARITNCTDLLPSAFYELAIVPMAQRTDVFDKLSSHDMGCLFLGRGRILQRYQIFIQNLLNQYPPGKEYKATGNCCNRRAILLHLATVFTHNLDCIPNLEKTSTWRSMDDIGMKSTSCEECSSWLFGSLRALEAEIWKNIPVYFNLPTPSYRSTQTRRACFT